MHSATSWLTPGLAAFFWALMFYLGQYALVYLSPEAVGAWRFLLGGTVLLPWMLWRKRPNRAGLFRNGRPLSVMAVVGIGGFNLTLSPHYRHLHSQCADTGDILTAVPLGVGSALVAMGLFGSGVAYVWWNEAVRTVGAGIAAVFMNLVPVFTALIGVSLGQTITLSQLAGTVLVLSGVWLSTSRARPVHRFTPHPTKGGLI